MSAVNFLLLWTFLSGMIAGMVLCATIISVATGSVKRK